MIGKPRKYCAPRSVAYPLRLLDLAVDAYAQGRYKQRDRGASTPGDSTRGNSARFLLMMSGHLGDALTLSYTFPLIRRAYPDCIIDVVAGDWCDPILVGNRYIRRLIHLNHANTNRRKIGGLAKWRDHWRTTRAAIAALKNENYTASVDVRFSDSPMHFLLPFIRVQRAVGFGSRGMGGLLDEEFFLPDGEFHHMTLILEVLQAVGVQAELADVQPYFDIPESARQRVQEKLPVLTNDRPLFLLFPESGAASRFLPDDFWRGLAGRLLTETDGYLIGCGQQPQTSELMQQIAANHPGQADRIHEAVGKLNLHELAALSERATAAITLESLPAHLCSIFCPTVSFFYNGTGLQFFPLANHPALVLHNHRPSQDLTIDRPGFVSRYVERFDADAQQQALDWLQTTLVKKHD